MKKDIYSQMRTMPTPSWYLDMVMGKPDVVVRENGSVKVTFRVIENEKSN